MGVYEINIEEFCVENPTYQRRIYGKIYYPIGPGKFPAVILSHGFNGSHQDFEMECACYAMNGFIAYAYDFCGGSVAGKSDGATTDMTIFSEKSDLIAAYEAVRGWGKTDPERIFLFGGSQGGLVTALAAEELQDSIRAMALYYPAFNIPEDWRKNYPEIKDIPEITELWEMKLGKIFFEAIHDFYTFEEIGSFREDVLIIYGSEDPIVPSGAMERAEQVYEHIRLEVLPGEGHGFSPEGAKHAMNKVLLFMQEHSE